MVATNLNSATNAMNNIKLLKIVISFCWEDKIHEKRVLNASDSN